MRGNERLRKTLSILLCLCMLVQNCPVVAFAAGEDNLCEHHPEHTAECGYREGSAGSACTHEHSEDCYAILECLHTCGEECADGCTHECTVENGCITMELDCHHVHGDCGYSEGTAEVPCGHVHNESCGYVEAVAGNPCANAETDPECDHSGDCGYVAAVEGQPCGHTACDDTCGYAPATEGTPCTHVCSVDAGCYKLLCSHSSGGHDDACGYVAAVEAHECHYECAECANNEQSSPTSPLTCVAIPEGDAQNQEIATSAPDGDLPAMTEAVCTCGTDDPAIHAVTCAVYVAPENPVCTCAEACGVETQNFWCDVCGFDYTACTGADTAAAYAEGDVVSVTIGGETTYYTSIIDAVAKANESGNATITLLQDTTTKERLDITQSTTLDLNGNTLSCATYFADDYETMVAVTTSGAKLTIMDSIGGGKLDGTDTTFVLLLGKPGSVGYTYTSSAEISGGTVSGWVRMQMGSSMTVSGGTVENNTSSSTVEMYSETTLNVSSGQILNTYEYGNTRCAIDNGGTVNITGGTVSGYIGVRNSGTANISGNANIIGTERSVVSNTDDEGALTITGGSYTGGIVVSGGTATISGGTITESSAENAVEVFDSAELTISGGTFSATAGGTWDTGVYVHDGGTVKITGGTITSTAYGVYNERGSATITGGSISGGTVDLYVGGSDSILNLTLDEGKTVGATFPGGITVEGNNTLTELLATDTATYWGVVDGKDTMLTVADDATSITDKGDITIRTICDHKDVKLDYITTETTHTPVCSVCNWTGEATEHTGGTATCQDSAVCDACGVSYGDLDANIHTPTEGTIFTDNGDGTHSYTCACGAAVAEVPHTLDVTTGKCSACGADMTVVATVTDGTNTCYAADAATLNQAVTAILETGSRTFTVELPADAEAGMITAIRRAICDTEGVADGSIHLTLKGVTTIPGTTNWDGVAFGPGDIYDEAGKIVDQELVTQLASINLPDVTEIGAQAFYFCENLVTVSAPKAQTIGAQAFGYTALTSVEFPELTTIPTDMFSGTWTLSSAKFPKVTTIEQGGLLVGAKFAPENNPTPFPLELTAEGNITFNGSNHFNIASQNYSGKVDLVLWCDKKDAVTFHDDGTATWQVRDDLSYTFKSITFKHSYVNGKCESCGEDCAHTGGTATCTTLAVCDTCGASYGAVDTTNHDSSVECENGFCENGCYEPATLNAAGYYEIDNAGKLFWFAQQVNVKGNREIKGVLTAGIDLENKPWTPIGETGEENNNFRGVFDGQNHTIRGLYVEGSENGVGFFGEVRTGTVKNFRIYGNVVVNTEVNYVGGVIGSICGLNSTDHGLERNGAIIQNITSFVNVTAKAHGIGMIGGFVGYANHQSLIEKCAWYGTFDAGEYRVDSGAGGFIGKIQENTSEVTIRNCGAYGTIKTNYAGDYNNTATIYMGGFLSFSNTSAKTTLENCLFAGRFERGENLTDQAFLGAFGTLRSVNAIKNCYYLGDDGLEAVHSDSNLKPGSDNVEITSVTGEDLRGEMLAVWARLGEYWMQDVHYPIPKDTKAHSDSATYTYTDNGDGTHKKTCNECGYVEEVKEEHYVDPTTTTYTDNGNGTHSFKCAKCDAVMDSEPHTPDAAGYTVGTDGTHSFTCVCGVTVTEAHTYVDGTCACGINLFTVSGSTLTIDGTLGGKTEATEEDITVLVNKIQDCVDNGITTIIVTGGNPAVIEVSSIVMPAVSEAIYRLSGNGNYDENNPYKGKIDLVLPDVTEIVAMEFYAAFALNSITLPKVTTVGDGAFTGCYYLKKMTFGSVVTSINQSNSYVFYEVGKEVDGGSCDLVLNCGQLQTEDTYKPDLENNVWFKPSWGGNVTWKSITLTHTEGTAATCIAQAVCSVCGESYGDIDADAHSYGDWVSNGDGTHKRTCANDSTHTENGDCSGGTATCKELAVCDSCKTPYGELGGHTAEPTYAPNAEDSTKHDVTYSCCGATVTESHTFTDGACTVCGVPCDHKDSTHTTATDNGDGTHSFECSVCVNTVIEDHTGGTATCTEQAECQHCGASYGELAAHTPDTNGKCTVDGCGYQYAAKVGDTFYETIHKALRAAEGINGCTLTLLDDVTLTSMSSYASYVNTGTFTLDLNGKTLSSNKRTLEVMGSADLTIRDSIGGGKIVSTDSSAVYLSGGKLTIESGIFEGTLDGVFLSGTSTLIVKGGTFTGSRAMITGFGSNVEIDLTAIDPSGLTLKNNGSGTFAPKLPEGYGMVGSDGKLLSSLSAEQSATVHKHEFKYTDLGDGNHQQACSCGLTTGEPAAHSITAEDDRPATCVAKAYCSVCDSEYGEVDKTNHVSENYTYTDNGDGTHTKTHECGVAVGEPEHHTIENYVCTACGVKEIVVSSVTVWPWLKADLNVGCMLEVTENIPTLTGMKFTDSMNGRVTGNGELVGTSDDPVHIGVTVTNESSTNTGFLADNAKWSNDGSVWTSDTVTFYADNASSQHISAYYPYAENGSVAYDLTSGGYLLYRSNQCVTSQYHTVDMMDQMLARLVVEPTLSEALVSSGDRIKDIEVSGIYTEATFDGETGTLTTTGDPNSAICLAENADGTWETLLIPMDGTTVTLTIHTVNGRYFTTTTPTYGDDNIGAGIQWNVAVNVGHAGEPNYADNGNGTHSAVYPCCGTTFTEPHSTTAEDDKKATCEAKAYCSVCDSEYGELLDHVMNPTTGLCTSGCGKMMAEASVTKGGSTTYYETLNEAIQAVSTCTAGDKAEVKLLSSLTLTETVTISGGVFTLDLNGKDVTFSKDTAFGFDISGGDVTFAGTGTVTMENGTAIFAKEDAVVTISGGTYDGAVAVLSYGTATITGGTLKGSGFGIRNLGNLTIAGGEVSSYQKNTSNPYNVTAIISSEGRITVTGGTLKEGRFGMIMYQDGTIDLVGFPGAKGVTIWRDDLPTVEMEATDVMLPDGFGLFDEKGTQQTGSIAKGTMLTVKQLHVHDWNYTADGDTITAACKGTIGECPEAEQSITICADDKTYDGTPVTATLNGSVDGVTVSANDITYSGNTNAGTYTASITIEGKTASVEFTIEKATVTVTADAKSKPYGTDNPTLTYTSEGLLGDDVLTGALATTATKTSNAGAYDITVGSLANSNYTIDFVGAKLTITKATAPAIVWPTAAELTYGQKLSDSTLTSQDENGTFAWQDGSIVPTVKNNGYVVVYTPKDTDNYDYTVVELTETIPVTVSKVSATVTAAPTPNDLTYTGEALYLISAGEATGGEMHYSTDKQTWSTTIPQGTDAGKYTVYYKVVGDANHSDTAVDSIEVTIAKADPVIGTVGCKMPLFDSTDISTVELTRTNMTVDGTLILTDSKLTAGEGTYNWKFTPEDTANYNTITGTVVLTVTADVLEQIRATGTLEKFSYVYGEPFSIDGMTVTAEYTSGTTKDVTGLVSFDRTLAVGQTAVELTYQGKICVIDGITVARKQLDVSGMAWDVPENAVYSGTAYTATLTGELPEGVTVTKTGDTATNAGSYTAKAVFSLADGFSADNYEIVNGADLTAAWSVDKAALTITADSYESVPYGSAAPAFAANYSGFVNGETEAVLGGELVFSCKYDTADAAKRKPGNYPIVPSGLTSNNYEISYVDGNLEVISANLVLVIDDKTVTYGDAAPEYTYHYEGFVYGEDISVMDEPGTVSCAYVPGNAVGTMEILSDNYGEDDCYYVVNQRRATLTIEKLAVAEPTVSGTYTYTGSEQAVTLTGMERYMTIASGNEAVGAGSYEVVITLDGNHKWADGSDGKVRWSIAKAEPKAEDFVFQAPGNLTYNGETKSASVSVKTGIEGMGKIIAVMYYNADSSPAVEKQPVSAGNYFVQINVAAGENYTEKSFFRGGDWVFSIGKAKAEITVNTTPITVTYGETVTLPVANTNFGTVSCDKTANDLVNVGTYTVTYTVADTASFDGDTKTVTVTIKPKTITEADVKLNGSLTYTGSEQTQPIAVSEGITYTVTGDKATDAGTYELIVKGTGNYTGEVKLSWSIKKAAAVVTKAPAAKTLTYIGEAQELITAGEAEGGTMQYQLNDGAWSASIPTAKDEGTYTVSWKVVGDANHADTEVKSITVTIGDCTHAGNTNKDDADCTTQVTCSVCGDVLVESKAHVWGDWTTTLEPTTTTEGSKERLCTNDECEAKDTDSIPMLNEVEVPEEIVGGDVSVDNPTPATGEDVTITVTPDTGKEIVDVVVRDEGGNEIPVTKNEDGSYTYEQPDGNVTIEVEIKDSEYEIDIQQPEGGKVETDEQNPNMGDKVTVTVTPEPGKEVDDITVTDNDGNEIPVTDNGDGTYSYEQPAGDVNIDVTMKDSEYEVEIEQPQGGKVETDNESPILGEDVTITVTPDTGKEVDEVIVTGKDGKEIPVTDNGDGTYTYEQPDGNVTVEVIIKDTIYTVTWTVDGTTYKQAQYKYGETITAPVDPVKAQSGCTTYAFEKWNGFTSGMSMPDNDSLTFAAVFTEGESHIDENTDHICDRSCGKTDIGDHVDGNLDHVCDYGCDVAIGEHKDANKDHVCDYGCTETIGTCEDADKDHDCDYGCDKVYGEHADSNKDHICDYGCTESFGTCEDADKDHDCDYGCDKVYGTHEDTDKDHACDYGCSETIGTCEDADKDHDCDYGCDKVYGDHKDTVGDGDHVCDYGCGEILTDCADVDTDKDHLCDECGAAMPKDGLEVIFPVDTTGTIIPGAPAEIDGKPIVIDWDGEIWLEDTGSKLITTYTFETNESGLVYPTEMYVWHLNWTDRNSDGTVDHCEAVRIPELDNLMTYQGTSIRIGGSSDGIRFFTAVPADAQDALIKGTLLTGVLEGYRLVEMGTLYKWAETGTELTTGNGVASYVYGKDAGSKFRVFSKNGEDNWFTGMLVGLDGEAATLAKDIFSRPYAILENADGEQITLYGGSVQRSVYDVALQNKDTWKSGTAYDNYVEKIIATVEAAEG